MNYQATCDSWFDEVNSLCEYLNKLAKKSIRGTDEFKKLDPTERINIAIYLENIIDILDKEKKS